MLTNCPFSRCDPRCGRSGENVELTGCMHCGGSVLAGVITLGLALRAFRLLEAHASGSTEGKGVDVVKAAYALLKGISGEQLEEVIGGSGSLSCREKLLLIALAAFAQHGVRLASEM